MLDREIEEDRGEKERERETERDRERESARIKVIECLTGKFKGEQSANSYETDTQGADIPPNGNSAVFCVTLPSISCAKKMWSLANCGNISIFFCLLSLLRFAGKSKSAVFGSMSDLISLHGESDGVPRN